MVTSSVFTLFLNKIVKNTFILINLFRITTSFWLIFEKICQRLNLNAIKILKTLERTYFKHVLKYIKFVPVIFFLKFEKCRRLTHRSKDNMHCRLSF